MPFSADRSLEASRIEEVRKELDEEQKATVELTRDMTRQYKGMQEELLGRVRNPINLVTWQQKRVSAHPENHALSASSHI
jgi:hypothetical protein